MEYVWNKRGMEGRSAKIVHRLLLLMCRYDQGLIINVTPCLVKLGLSDFRVWSS